MYLTYLDKRKDTDLKTGSFKEELVRRQIYSPAIRNKKSFMKDVAIPDAAQLVFTITNERRTYAPSEGEKQKCFIVTVHKSRTRSTINN